MTILPRNGISRTELEAQLADAKRYDADWRGGKMAYYVHFANDEVLEVAKSAYGMFLGENAAATEAFPSTRISAQCLTGGKNAKRYQTLTNFGLLLRWEAALYEMAAFASVPEGEKSRLIYQFMLGMSKAVRNVSSITLPQSEPLLRNLEGQTQEWDAYPIHLRRGKI